VRWRVAALAVLAAVVLAGCTGQPPAAPGRLSQEGLQLRPVEANTASGCGPTDTAVTPPPGGSVTLLMPNTLAPGPCVRLGPVVLAFATVKSVDLGKSAAGLTLVAVRLTPPELTQYQEVVKALPRSKAMAWVFLDQVLSLPTQDELAQPGAMSGRIQIAGGLSAQDPRPRQIAQVLKRIA